MTDAAPSADAPRPSAADPITVTDPLPAANEAPPIDTPLLAEQLPSNEPQVKPARLRSLDVFRGLTLALMTIVNNPGGTAYAPLEHADWGKGWTPTDLVFPFFLFIVGVAIPFSLGKRSTVGQTRGQLLGTIWLRALSLFMVGQLLAGIGNIPGVKHPDDPFVALPETFRVLWALRWIVMIYAYAAVIALLIPWRPSRRAWIWPVSIAVSFYALAGVMAWANHYALTHGAPENTYLGIGLFKPGSMRIPGVLQRIGLVYGIAASVAVLAGWRTALLTSLFTCALYTLLMFYAPFHDPDNGKSLTGIVTQEHNFARAVDEGVFIQYERNPDGSRARDPNGKVVKHWDHTYREYPDNEGLLSTLPAITNALIGVMAGLWLRTLRPAGERCAGLFCFGVFALLIGYFLDAHSLPINKTIWTPAYAFVTGGLGLITLAIVYFTVDINGYRKWSWPFIVLGMNSIAVFVANSFLVRALGLIRVRPPFADASADPHVQVSLGSAIKAVTAHWVHGFGDWFHAHFSPALAGVQSHFAPHGSLIINTQNSSLAYALVFLLMVWLVMLVLYVCKVFVKI